MIRAALAIKLAELAAARKNHGLTKIAHKGARAAVESAPYDATRRYCAAWSIAGPCLPGLWRVHDFLHVVANSANVAAVCLPEGEVVAARIADHIEPHHNDPIKVWNGKLQSLCARIAREQEEVRGEPRL